MNQLVSIIIPSFNNAETIIETLQSIEKQSYQNIEVIIVDDGSSDDLKSIVSEYQNSSPLTISYHFQDNAGPSVARNKGAQLARGTFLLFLDADDLIHENYVQKAVKVLNENPAINIVYADAEFFGAEIGKWELSEYNLQDFLKYNSIPIFAVIKKDVFHAVGNFDEQLTFTEDWELWIRIIKTYGGVYKIPETMYYYRKRFNKSSLSDNMNVNNNSDLSRLYIYNKHYDFYCENGLDLTSLINTTYHLKHFKKKYNNIWYKKLAAKFKNKNND
ncbi:glycosyltransferase [Flavobacterium amnicola]|uniref:Glycosyltransferase n=1 Tax=Flavobacterium amnicola TaxID=2506422 RepID=A0A4Q1K2C6_9FLAO|nr:glycosyltransferase [Flavobacterium amnicola]RXR19085.1 glycosyltransferase [Flavobacterium amnicola]